MDKQYLFSYGTILSKLDEYPFLTVVGPGYVTGNLYDLGEFPALTHDDTRLVKGVVLRVASPEHNFKVLDSYEGTLPQLPGASLYARHFRPLVSPVGDPQVHCAWVYYFNQSVGFSRRINSGDWLDR